MTYYHFAKVIIFGEENIIVFEKGKLSEPTLVLNQANLERLDEALKEKVGK